jgi:predicted enzyme related to lactoylglutathione lyase
MLEGVAVVWMPVQDIERAKGFYSDTLGLPITNEDGDWAEVDANGLTIGLNGREPSGAGVEGGPVVTFRPQAGLDKTIDDLKNQGVDVPAGISEHPWGRVATFKDSEGNDVQLYEPPAN